MRLVFFSTNGIKRNPIIQNINKYIDDTVACLPQVITSVQLESLGSHFKSLYLVTKLIKLSPTKYIVVDSIISEPNNTCNISSQHAPPLVDCFLLLYIDLHL